MPHRLQESTDVVVLEPTQAAAASVIWLHGLGADGHDFVPIVPELGLPADLSVRFLFPHAPMRPVTINAGMRMRAWYDIKILSGMREEDEPAIRDSAAIVTRFIAREREAGIPADRILLAGFSQGGAIALQTALRQPERLAGVLALSTYLPLAPTLEAERSDANRDIPILMCHGTADPMLPMRLGEASRDFLGELGYKVEWKQYPMAHQVCLEQLRDIGGWLGERLAAN